MDQDSYWHGYLMARQNVLLILGIVLMVMALIFALTGSSLVKGQRIVSRAEDPKMFWWTIAVNCLLGLFFLGLYLYTVT